MPDEFSGTYEDTFVGENRSALRILHVTPSYIPAWRYGGTIHSVHGLCKSLVRIGHKVTVATTTVNGPQNLFIEDHRVEQLDGVDVHYFRANRLRRVYWSSYMEDYLRNNIHGYDVVHSHSVFLWPAWAAARHCRATGVPHVTAPRGMLVAELVRRRSRLIKSISIALRDRKVVETADAVHFTSQREMDDCLELGIRPKRSAIVPNGVDSPPKELSEENVEDKNTDRDYILYLGRISWKKNIELVIKALARIPGAKLVIAGNDDEGHMQTLQRVSREAGVSQRIDYLGPVYGDQKLRLLNAASVVVLPSVSENFGNVVLEAMSVGTPVVVTRGVGLADAVEKWNAGLVSKETDEDIAQCIARITGNSKLRDEMANAGRRAVREQFEWGSVAQKMEGIYRDIIRMKSGMKKAHEVTVCG